MQCVDKFILRANTGYLFLMKVNSSVARSINCQLGEMIIIVDGSLVMIFM